MSGSADLRMDGNVLPLLRDLVRVQKEQSKINLGLLTQVKNSKKTGRAAKDSFSLMASSAKSAVTAMIGGGGVLAAIRLINSELQKQIRLQAEAAGTQITLASARRDLTRNLIGFSDPQIKSAFSSAAEIAKNTGVSEAIITQGLASGVSASGGDLVAAKDAVRVSAKFLSDKPDQIALNAGALLDLSQVTGTKDARVNQGLLQFVGGTSRITSPELQAKNIAPTLIALDKLGFSAQGAAALVGAGTVRGADVTGERTGTAVIGLAEQLREAFPDIATGSGRIRHLQQNKTVRDKFLKGFTGEKKTLQTMIEIITGGTEGAALFNQNFSNLPDSAGLATLSDQTLDSFNIDPLSGVAELARKFNVNKELIQTDPSRGQAGAIRQGVSKLLDASGQGALAGQIRDLDLSIGSPDIADAQRLLAARAKELETKRFREGRFENAAVGFVDSTLDAVFAGPTPNPFSFTPTVAPLEQDASAAEMLRSIIIELQKFNDNNKPVAVEVLPPPGGFLDRTEGGE